MIAAIASEDGSKKARYDILCRERKACRVCGGDLANPAVVPGDSEEIGAWSRWQGNLDAEVMVVGQDWGSVRNFTDSKGNDTDDNATNRTLVELLRCVDIEIPLPSASTGRGVAFFTNAILCLKQGGAQAPVRKEWFRNCGKRFLRPLIDIVKPKVVVCLGEQAYRAVLYDKKPRRLRQAVESEVPERLDGGIAVLAVYHCGARTIRINRNLDAQRGDWRRIRRFLAGS
jgi:uracil-DNA glycosylase family 4